MNYAPTIRPRSTAKCVLQQFQGIITYQNSIKNVRLARGPPREFLIGSPEDASHDSPFMHAEQEQTHF